LAPPIQTTSHQQQAQIRQISNQNQQAQQSQQQTIQIGTISHEQQQTPVTVQTTLAQAIHQLQPTTTQVQVQQQNFQNIASYSFPLANTGTESLPQMPETVQQNQFQQNPTSTVATTGNSNGVPPVSLSSLVLPGLLNLLHEQENSNETENNTK
jgi:hypothetical protein